MLAAVEYQDATVLTVAKAEQAYGLFLACP